MWTRISQTPRHGAPPGPGRSAGYRTLTFVVDFFVCVPFVWQAVVFRNRVVGSENNFANNFRGEGRAITESRGGGKMIVYATGNVIIFFNFFGFKIFTYLFLLFGPSDT